MNCEIERKFLLQNETWRQGVIKSTPIKQGYFETASPTLRVRIKGEKGFLTIKGKPCGIVRAEFEYQIPAADAEIMLRQFCGSRIVSKIRHIVPAGNDLFWEIDEYLELNQGLFTAEIELPTPITPFERPEWLGPEVSGQSAFTNAALSRHPWTLRSDTERALSFQIFQNK